MLLTELTRDNRSRHNSEVFEEIDLWEDEGLGLVDVEVEFEFESAHHTDHPMGMGSAREYHAAEVTIFSVKLVEDVDVIDEDGKVFKTMKAGTDLLKQPFYKDSDSDFFIDKLLDIHEKAVRDDYNEDD